MRHELPQDDACLESGVNSAPASVYLRGIPDLSPRVWDAFAGGVDFYMAAAQHSLVFNQQVKDTLFDEPAQGKYDISVFGRVSKLVGGVINGRYRLADLFEHGDDHLSNDWRPAEEQFDALGELVQAPPYKLLVRMLRDTAYPYAGGEGYSEVTAREPEKALQVCDAETRFIRDGKFCDYSEEFFGSSLLDIEGAEKKGRLRPIKQRGRVFGYQKTEADNTVLLSRPILMNGVRIEPGAIMTIGGDEARGYTWGFGRLTAFNCDTFYEAVRYFARNLANNALRFSADERSFERSLFRLRSMTGRSIRADSGRCGEYRARGRDDSIMLYAQKRIHELSKVVSVLRGPGEIQEAARENALLSIYGLKRTMIEHFGWKAAEEAHIAYLGHLAWAEPKSFPEPYL